MCAVAIPAAAQQSSFQWHTFVSARGVRVEAQPSWTAEGIGRFDVGAANADDDRILDVETAQIGFDWTPTRWLTFHADGVGRREPAETGGRRAGLLQAYVEVFSERLRLRAGTFWLPTSRENIEPLWTSPYTITFSALNSWMGQEIRPVGIDVQYSPNFYLTFGATAFGGIDTMGTVLSARGWTFGNRLSVYGEELPLPAPEGTTRAIGPDLDDRIGYSARIRGQLPERVMVQIAHIDNRSELVPEIKGQEPWQTRLNILSAQAGTSPTILAAEYAWGWTALGFPGGMVRIDLETTYVLVSHKRGSERWTMRVEQFSTRDHRRPPDDSSRESGRAYTLAWMRDIGKQLRLGIEYVKVDGDRPGAQGFDPRSDGSTWTVELRWASSSR